MKFELIVPNPDVDVHPDPPGLWQHVAVICRWKDAHAQRKQWPHAAVIGPLRTVRGLDELARNLLHNPQIRVGLVVGNDLTPDEVTTKALIALWKGEPEGEKHTGEDVRGPFWDAQTLVQLVVGDLPTAPWRRLAQFPDLAPPWTHETKPPDYNPPCGHFHGRYGCTSDWCGYGAWRTFSDQYGREPEALGPISFASPLAALVPSDYQSERPKVTLPPPPPVVNATAPAGDPGERVVGETLADLWPQILHRAMRFGAERPTHYGPTRELLCLVGVVRDVEKSVAGLRRCPSCGDGPCQDTMDVGSSCPAVASGPGDLVVTSLKVGGSQNLLSPPEKHPVLGISLAEVEAYRDRVSTAVVPEGAAYGYGSRMRGVPTLAKMCSYHTKGWCHYCVEAATGPDQIEAVEKLLREKPDTRAAFVTPWRPMEDAGRESGRPCLVGGWFRVEEGPVDLSNVVEYNVDPERGPVTQPNHAHAPGKPGNYGLCGDVGVPVAHQDNGFQVTCRKCLAQRAKRLHLVVAFRSHDLHSAYPTNIAGIMLWQSELAARLGMRAGSLTCTSYSAHVYERDWTAAEEVIAKHYETNREPQWDQRSTFHVELVQPVIVEKPVEVGETLQVPRSASGVLDVWEVQAEPVLDRYDHVWIENQTNGERRMITQRDWRDKRGDYRGPQPKPTLRATALTPDGGKVLRVFEAETSEALRAQVERSGLVTSVGAALWLGDEIRRVAGRS